MAQCYSDVERRMWVKGNFGGINNSGRKIARGGGKKLWAMQRLMHRDPEIRGPESNNISQLSPLALFTLSFTGTEMISLSVKSSHKVHIPAYLFNSAHLDKVQYNYKGHKNGLTTAHSKRLLAFWYCICCRRTQCGTQKGIPPDVRSIISINQK